MMTKTKVALLLTVLLATSYTVQGGRLSSRGRSSSGSSWGSGRRGGSSSQSSSHTVSSGHVTKPTFQHANADNAKLSYAGYNSQPNKPGTSVTQNKPPIGWNVPNSKPEVAVNKPPSYAQANAGPPPAYSPHNVPGGAKTNVNEPPPMYKPNNQAPPSYPGNNAAPASYPRQPTNTASGYPHQTAPQQSSHNTGHHHRTNGTGGSVPFQAQTVRPVQASYPHASSGQIQPQQATYSHASPGQIHPQNIQPQQASYPQQPMYFPQGSYTPHGSYTPVGGYAPPPQGQPVFAGSGIQPGFYPAGSLPIQKSSSGPGFGTGLAAGVLGGALLGHALTPTHHHDHAAAQDRVIVINNNPAQPAVAGEGAVAQPAVVQPVASQPGQPAVAAGGQPIAAAPQPQPAAGQPIPPAQPVDGSIPSVPLAPFPNQQPNGIQQGYPDGIVPLAPLPQNVSSENNNATAPNEPVYGIMCIPVLVNVTDPNNPTNYTTMEQIACYNTTQPPPPSQPLGVQPGAPPQQSPDLMQMPGQYIPQVSNDINPPPTQKPTAAILADSTKLNNSGSVCTSPGMLALIVTLITYVSSMSLC